MITTAIDDFRQDLRFAWRQLRRAPAFAATVIVTLALGVGANTGIFSVINGFLRPLPVPAADRIVVLAAERGGDETGVRYRFSYPALADYRAQADVFSDLFAFDTRIGGVTLNGKTTQFLYHFVSGNFFAGLGLVPAAGRLVERGEGEQLGTESVVVLGHVFWLKQFGGNREVLGTLIRIDGRAARVIGVAPQGFRGLFEGAEIDGYVPLSNLRLARQPERLFSDRSFHYLTMVGRLKPGTSLAKAQAVVGTVAQRLAVQYPVTEKGTNVRVIPEPLARPLPLRFFTTILPVIRALLLILAAVVLLLACLNVTNLLYVRATVRQHEMAVRSALGAGRGRLIRLLLAESFLLAFAGTLAGLVLGRWSSALVVGSFDLSMDLPLQLDMRLDWRVFSYALATAIATGIVIGVVPAFRASRTNVTEVLHDGGRGGSAGAGRNRLRNTLVVAQLAGSLVLLVVAGIFVRNLQDAQRIDLGFDPDHLLTMRFNASQLGYDLNRATEFYDQLERRVRALPGVEHAATSFNVPMGYIFDACPIEPEGAPPSDEATRLAVGYNAVGTDYFTTLGLPLMRGRAFGEHETGTSPRATIVNETLAARLWPGQNPIGKRLNAFCMNPGPPWEVVGVARDSKYIAVFERQLPYLYFPTAQSQPFMRVLQIRSALPPDELAARVRREADMLDPEMPIADVRTMNQAFAGGLGYLLFRFGAMQATAMGLLGLLLAVVGLYGVVSYGASQRMREMGIRLALGASPVDVRRLVLRQGARLVAEGVVVGLVLSVLVSTLLTRFLVLVSASDPVTFLFVTVALIGIALVACYLPARRAMRVDPMTALRHE